MKIKQMKIKGRCSDCNIVTYPFAFHYSDATSLTQLCGECCNKMMELIKAIPQSAQTVDGKGEMKMDVSYVTKAYLTNEDVEANTKQVVYAGTSPKQAFSHKNKLSDLAKCEVEIWEYGYRVFRHKQYTD